MCCQMKLGEGEREGAEVVEVLVIVQWSSGQKVGSGRWG